MDQLKIGEREFIPGIGVAEAKPESRRLNFWVTRLTMVALQVIIVVAVFQVIRGIISESSGVISSNIYLSILGCILATLCAYLIILKYQTLIRDFSRENVRLGERLGARTFELEKTNAEMRQEIAERRRVEKALVESESRFRTIIREAAIGIALIDRRGRVIEGNPALLTMLGYTGEELRTLDFNQICHPENVESSRQILRNLLNGNQDVCRIESRYVRKDGWSGWGRQSISLVREAGGRPQFIIALCEDITERRESEEKIRTYQEQLQSLASELCLTEERERRRLATLLHDHIGQLLVLAKARFEKIQESTVYRSLAKPLEEVRRLIEESIRYTRSLTFELSPPILYDLGFEEAMDWLAEHMHKQYGLTVKLQDDGLPKPLDHEVRALLFRAVRELLFNVLKHSKAKRARLKLKRDGARLQICVEDNGVGFTPEQLKEGAWKMEGFGLFSVRERLKYFGGTMQIESTPGEVTRVNLIIPLEPCKKTRGKPLSSQGLVKSADAGISTQVSSPSGSKPPAPPSCAVN